jgi:hypothetical protein
MSLQTANQIIKTTQREVIKSYQSDLSKKEARQFRSAVGKTIDETVPRDLNNPMKRNVHDNAKVIRTMKYVNDPRDFCQSNVKIISDSRKQNEVLKEVKTENGSKSKKQSKQRANKDNDEFGFDKIFDKIQQPNYSWIFETCNNIAMGKFRIENLTPDQQRQLQNALLGIKYTVAIANIIYAIAKGSVDFEGFIESLKFEMEIILSSCNKQFHFEVKDIEKKPTVTEDQPTQ